MGASKKRPSTAQKLEALKEGRHLPVNPYTLAHGPVGDVPDTDERAVLELASAIHHSESDRVAVSWESQERAAQFFNEHGLARTLDEMFRLEAMPKCGGKGCAYCCIRCLDCRGFHPTESRDCGEERAS